MKRTALLMVVCLLFVHTAWAGRARVSSIAKDPYISALVMDADTGKVLIADDPDAVVYPASVLKLMNLMVILDQVKEGRVKLDDMVQVTREAARTGGSQVYLDPREQFSVDELLYALMVQSANDAAVALAIHVAGSKEGFVALMNQKAQELGMKNTRFYSVHGLPPGEGQKPDETTAFDLSILCRELSKMPEALKYTSTRERGFRDGKFIMRNHNHLLGEVEGCDGFKTGYFEAAGFSIAATAKRGAVRIIAIVMGSKNRKVRDAKAAEFLTKGFSLEPAKALVAAPIKKPEQAVAQVETVPVAPATPQRVVPRQTEKQPGTAFMAGWWKFFLGLGLGLLIFVLKLLLTSRRHRKERVKYVRHP
jgi:serine-type D-Ala-D-Ala carboxypeptidase (penicillin-binding protein 5/6)